MFGGLSFQSFSLGLALRELPSCRANYVKLFLFIFRLIFCAKCSIAQGFDTISCKIGSFVSDTACVERRKAISGDKTIIFTPLHMNNTVTKGKPYVQRHDAENLPNFNIILHKRGF